MAKVDGFHVQFTHRGSWKADLLPPGRPAEVIPVTWKADWDREKGTIFVWLKKPEEVQTYMQMTAGFRIAVGVKNADGGTSAENIIGIFWVKPLHPSTEERTGLTCTMERRAKPGDTTPA